MTATNNQHMPVTDGPIWRHRWATPGSPPGADSKLEYLCFMLIALAGVYAIWGDSFYGRLAMWIVTNALLASAMRFVNLIGRYNFATAAFYGIGAYAGAIGTSTFGLPFFFSLLAAVAVAVAIGAAFAAMTLHIKATYFMLASLAFAEILRLTLGEMDFLGGNSGLVGIYPPAWMGKKGFPAISIFICLLALIALWALEKSRLGQLFVAVRCNEDLVRASRINASLVKISCFVIACAASGLAGGLYAHGNTVISPGDFTVLLAVYVLTYMKVGGEARFIGPIIGATVLTVASQLLSRFAHYEVGFFGVALVLSIMLIPKGLADFIPSGARSVNK